MKKSLEKIHDKEWMAGICNGIAYYIECPVWIVRLVFFLAILADGTGLIVYILLAIFMPVANPTPTDFRVVVGIEKPTEKESEIKDL